METIKIKLRQAPEQQLQVTLTSSHRPSKEIEGYLPALPQPLQSCFEQWQSAYRDLEEVRSYFAPAPGLRLSPKGIKIASYTDNTKQVKELLNQWLNYSDSHWQPIRDALISFANQLQDKETHILLDAKDINLQRLPWQEWNLLEDFYPHTEIALKARKTNVKEIAIAPPTDKVRILMVVGRSDGINTTSDLQVVQELEEKGAEVICLMQPNLKDLCEALWDETGYHIFIFTGHSGSDQDGNIGWIEVNDKESLTIEEFKEAIKQAIDRGLQLAIFNSCDGLGLAQQLAQLDLLQTIVMREPVPDLIAIEFFKHFFKEFTQNKSLFTCVNLARKRLEPFKSKYPGAIWLPILYLQSAGGRLTWRSLVNDLDSRPLPHPEPQPKFPLLKNLFTILATTILSFGVGVAAAQLTKPTVSQPPTPETSTISSVKGIPEGNWQYGGSTTWAPIRGKVDEQIKKLFPKFKLIYSQHPTLPAGSGTGIKMLLDGQLSFGQSSRPILDSEYSIAAQRGVLLKQIPVAMDGIAIVVNPQLNIKQLTLEQLQNIYTGKITNWRQLGGPDLEIIPYSRPESSGTTEFFQENVLEHKSFSDRVKFVDETTLIVRKIKENLGSIYYASASEVIKQCNVKPLAISRRPGSAYIAPYQGEYIPPERCPQERNKINLEVFQNGEYPLTRRLFVIIKQNGQADEEAGETYSKFLLTKEGQDLILKADFVPIRSF